MVDQVTEGILSPWLRRQRVHAALPYVRGKVLDYGCGSGILANYVHPENYCGVDKDEEVLNIAKLKIPTHRFLMTVPKEKFDSIILLAVIEHIPDPTRLVQQLTEHLQKNGQIILTTPHPKVDWIHTLGAKIKFFSRHASEEHEALLNKDDLIKIATELDINMDVYKKFLLGANQLCIYTSISSCY